MSRKYGSSAQKEIEKAQRERKQGKLTSGRNGKKVTNQKQAIAIGLSKARLHGGKAPRQS